MLALVCAAGGFAAAPSVTSVAAAREQAANAKADRLLDRIRLPAGAHTTRTVPPSLRHVNLGTSVITMFAYRHRVWKLHEPVAAVVSFVKQHAVRGFRNDAGCGLTCLNFDQAPVHGWPMQRMYAVDIARQSGWTFVRLDAAAAWNYPRSPLEAVPSAVREVDIRGAGVVRTVTARSNVARIVTWFDRLNVNPPGDSVICGPNFGVPVTFTFRAAGRARVASAVVPSEGADGCNPISFSIGHTAQTPLVDYRYGKYAFSSRVQHLLGVCFRDPARKCAPVRRATRLDTAAIVAARKRAATVSARHLLGAVVPPPAATKMAAPKEYGGVLRSIPTPFGEYVRRTQFWRVAAKPAAVAAFLQAHDVPAGFTAHCGTNRRFGSTQCEVSRGHDGSRQLEFGIQRTREGTILRVDAQVVWIYPRSTNESVRASRVREIDFSAPKVSKQVTDPALIARIVRWFNEAPLLPPGIGSPMCGPATAVPVKLDFRGAGRTVLAHVSVDAEEPGGVSGACNPMSVTIGGTRQPALISPHFIGRVQRALGVTVR